MSKLSRSTARPSRSWDPVADWYAGWSGPGGSRFHRRVAIPAVLDLLGPAVGERILDIGCGPAALAPHIADAGASYVGVDASRRLVRIARRHHGRHGRFLVANATHTTLADALGPGRFDAAVFLLSIQDIEPLDAAVALAARLLRSGGRCIVLMTHPCFRVPRQSGWGWDAPRKHLFRRIDRYLTPLDVPMKRYGPAASEATRSYHRPLERYVHAFAEAGLLVQGLREIPAPDDERISGRGRAGRRASLEIPLFLGLRGVKV